MPGLLSLRLSSLSLAIYSAWFNSWISTSYGKMSRTVKSWKAQEPNVSIHARTLRPALYLWLSTTTNAWMLQSRQALMALRTPGANQENPGGQFSPCINVHSTIDNIHNWGRRSKTEDALVMLIVQACNSICLMQGQCCKAEIMSWTGACDSSRHSNLPNSLRHLPISLLEAIGPPPWGSMTIRAQTYCQRTSYSLKKVSTLFQQHLYYIWRSNPR